MQLITYRKDGAFEGQRRVQIFFNRDTDKLNGKSADRCKPEFHKATRIEAIMKKALRTGLVDVRQDAVYGDFSSGNDFLTTQNRIIQMNQYFDSLPSETRDFFANSPHNYLNWILDPKNADQAVQMGLLKPKASPEPVKAASEPVKAPSEPVKAPSEPVKESDAPPVPKA